MFKDLKAKAVNKILVTLEERFKDDLNDKIEVFKSLKAADVANDDKYQAVVIKPLWIYVELQSSGAVAAAQKVFDVDMKARFSKGMFHVRDELIQVDGDKVILDPAFSDKLAPTLMAAFKAQQA